MTIEDRIKEIRTTPKEHRVSVSLLPSEKERLEAMAAKNWTSVSLCVRAIIRDYLAREAKAAKKRKPKPLIEALPMLDEAKPDDTPATQHVQEATCQAAP